MPCLLMLSIYLFIYLTIYSLIYSFIHSQYLHLHHYQNVLYLNKVKSHVWCVSWRHVCFVLFFFLWKVTYGKTYSLFRGCTSGWLRSWGKWTLMTSAGAFFRQTRGSSAIWNFSWCFSSGQICKVFLCVWFLGTWLTYVSPRQTCTFVQSRQMSAHWRV